jgi:hypothetical protein
MIPALSWLVSRESITSLDPAGIASGVRLQADLLDLRGFFE